MFCSNLIRKAPFDYTNSLIASIKQRIILHRGIKEIQQRCYNGKSNKIILEMNAYSMVKSIKLLPGGEDSYKDTNGDINTEKIVRDIKLAHWEAHNKLINDKESLYKQSISKIPELQEQNTMSRWFTENGSSLPPYPHKALQECNKPEWLSQLSNTSELAQLFPDFTPSMLALEDSKQVEIQQQRKLSYQENKFWHKVDLIRMAQRNTIPVKKRQYKEFTDPASERDNQIDKVEFKFVHNKPER